MLPARNISFIRSKLFLGLDLARGEELYSSEKFVGGEYSLSVSLSQKQLDLIKTEGHYLECSQ